MHVEGVKKRDKPESASAAVVARWRLWQRR